MVLGVQFFIIFSSASRRVFHNFFCRFKNVLGLQEYFDLLSSVFNSNLFDLAYPVFQVL